MPRNLGWSFVALLVVASACLHSAARSSAGSCAGTDPELPVIAAASLGITPALLEESWRSYKQRFIQDDGRVIDRKQGGITTSEGQAYALLRAVWMNDRERFERILRWTDDNLNSNARQDRLFAWRWGHRDDGSWGVHDRNAASDADQLIAYALVQAHRRWSDERMLARARALLDDIWDKETHQLGSTRFVLPGEWANDGPSRRINPSYYLPFAYRVFAEVDPGHAWKRLIDTSYQVFERSRSRVGLPVDWTLVDVESGEISVSNDLFDRSSDFGYDAYRVFWNLAADHLWYGEPRAKALLQEMNWLQRYWSVRRDLPAVVSVDGIPREQYKSLSLYGALFPAMALTDPAQGALLYREGLAPTYNGGLWGDPEDYYIQNLVWFGVALAANVGKP